MGKKILNSGVVYFVGMALIVVGLLCPIIKVLGSTPNVFKFLNFKNVGWSTIAFLLISVGAVLGVLFSIFTSSSKTKLLALLVSLAGGVILVLLMTGLLSDNGFASAIWKSLGKAFIKHAYIGFYLIIAGWVVAITGCITNK